MKYLLIVFLFALAKAQNDCTGVPDGTVVEWGCRSYTVCDGDQEVIVDCSASGQVFNPDIQACDDPANTPPPCGSNRDELCAYFVDGRYADWTDFCESYYTCIDQLYFGHNPCSPGTVFDEVLCLCNFPSEVYDPCGTKPDDDSAPTERGCPLNNYTLYK